jgi:hypothetical protein
MSEEDEFAIHNCDEIIDFLQNGGGRIVLSGVRRRRTLEFLAQLTEFGWRPEFLSEAFRALTDRLLAEYAFLPFVEDYFKAHIRRLDDTLHLMHLLAQMGLRAEIVERLLPLLEPLQGGSYSQRQILDTALFYLLKRYTPITPINTKHLVQPHVVDGWQTYNSGSKEIGIYNMSQTCTMLAQTALATAVATNPASPGMYTFFHTTSWRGSLAIMDNVDRNVGRRCLDFGIYPGFYMSETALDCLDWGSKKSKVWGNETAIMIFAIPETLPTHLVFKRLHGHEWSTLTKQARECKESQELRPLRSIDLLYGNMVSNPTTVEHGGDPMTHSPPKKQLASKTDAGDRYIHSCLVGCIYFQKAYADRT